ncbi:MAG: outer membrane protein transport protein [Myxococcota bacterium]
MSSARGLAAFGALLGTTLIASSSAFAGGYDTPILYSAQHMGMGGTAIGYVDDPTAMFHNPAGLARTMGLTFTIDATLILGSIESSPDIAAPTATHTSEPIMAVAPLIGVSVKPVDWLALGVAFYPVASAGAEYKYPASDGKTVTNKTDLVFLEIAPTVAFKLPGHVTLGAGWRIIMASLDRQLTNSLLAFDAKLSGTNLGGVRVGAQWEPIPELSIGVVFRNKTDTKIVDDSGIALSPDPRRIETTFTLPAKFGFGLALKLNPVLIAVDLEYALQSQNKQSTFLFGPDKQVGALPLVSVFRWHDNVTLRMGVEYTVAERFMFRGGFLFDTQVSNEDFPSAFGTPPTSTTTITAGFGMKCAQNWKWNFAVVHRFGSTNVERATPQTPTCLPCSGDGPYSLSMTGLYLDFTYSFANIFD